MTCQNSFLKLKNCGAQQMGFVVNANFQGKLKQKINLKNLNIPNSKYHVKPRQLVIKNVKGTVILFSSGSFKVMGCVDAIEASFLTFCYTDKINCDDIPKMYS